MPSLPPTIASLSGLPEDAFESAYPQDVLRWAVDTFGERLAIVTSFQTTGIITIHMLRQITAHVNIITLDTGLLFPETYRLMDQIEEQLDVKITRVRPSISVEEQANRFGDALWESDPDKCCHIRKTLPLRDALIGYQAWIAGLRRDQSSGRATIPVVGWDTKGQMVKLSPFANWTEQMVWTYIHAYELPYNTLHDQGYPSIGCYPCTKAIAEGQDIRAGRWSNSKKDECGIHVDLYASQAS